MEYYSELSGMMVDCASTLKVFKILQKETMTHLNKLNGKIFINNLLSQWFLSLFVHKTNMETFLTIWDAMFFEGYIVLIRAAIGILCIMKDRLLQLQTLEEVMTFFDNEIATFNQNEILSQFILDENCTISNDVVKHFRKLLLPAYVETITKSKENMPKVNNKEMDCDLDWPFCVDNFANCKINSCIVLTTTQGIEIKEDFYTGNVKAKVDEYKEIKKKEFENKGKIIKKTIVDISELEHLSEQYNVYKDLLIEREVHKCGCGKESSKDIQEQMKTKNNLFYKYYYENKDGSSKKKSIASSYFDFHDLKKNTQQFADIINNIEQRLENQHAVITLKRSKSRHQKRKEVQERKESVKDNQNESEE